MAVLKSFHAICLSPIQSLEKIYTLIKLMANSNGKVPVKRYVPIICQITAETVAICIIMYCRGADREVSIHNHRDFRLSTGFIAEQNFFQKIIETSLSVTAPLQYILFMPMFPTKKLNNETHPTDQKLCASE